MPTLRILNDFSAFLLKLSTGLFETWDDRMDTSDLLLPPALGFVALRRDMDGPLTWLFMTFGSVSDTPPRGLVDTGLELTGFAFGRTVVPLYAITPSAELMPDVDRGEGSPRLCYITSQ